MNLNLLESAVYGLFSGLTEILPVSGQAHRNLMLQLLGETGEQGLLGLMIHAGILVALYYSCQNHILRIVRARKLSRIPKKRRKRPLDSRSLMDFSLLKTMAVPAVLALLLYGKVSVLNGNRILLSGLLFVNGLILYVPQYLPGSNRDSCTLSRVEGLWMGLGGAISILPGISTTGAAASAASVCGVDRAYGLSMTLLLAMVMTIGRMVYDVLGIAAVGLSGISFTAVLGYILAGIGAFAGAFAAIRIMRYLSQKTGYGIFAFYCFGLSLFTFILYLAI